MSDTLLAVPGIERLSPAGRRATVDVARLLGADPDDLVTVMRFESAGSFDPAKRNPFSGATGLIQFLPSTAEHLGTSVAELARMSQDAQIRGPVYKYLAGFRGSLGSLERLYLAIFYPAAMGLSDDAIVFRAGEPGYEQNRGFDRQNSGVIRRGDIVATIRAVKASAGGQRVDVPAASFWTVALYFTLFGTAAYGIIRWGTERGKLAWP